MCWLRTRPNLKPKVVLKSEDWTRWNDYGIGLFLQGDLSGAAGAFEKITEIDPKNPDGWVNLGRARVQEGNLTAAREVLRARTGAEPEAGTRAFLLCEDAASGRATMTKRPSICAKC